MSLSNDNGFTTHPENINRAGGPDKLHWWSQLYVDELERDSVKREGYKKKQSVVMANIDKAEDGDMNAIKEVGDRVAGKAPLFIDHTTKGEQLTGFVLDFSGEKDGEVPAETPMPIQ